MSIHVALHHRTSYIFDRPVNLSPHEIRLRPAAHARTPILSYSLNVTPEKHFVNWQQDAYGNYMARLVFPEKTRKLEIVVDLVADMTVINPFDFFVEQYAEQYPFTYPEALARELAPFLEIDEAGPLLQAWLVKFRREHATSGIAIADFLVSLNQQLQHDISYLLRMEPGVQSCENTLMLKSGSCRDSGWLLVQVMRHFGLAARFVSGYLIQLTADVKALDGPSGTTRDFTDLHAWAEVYIPGAGWIGLDATSGLLTGESHIPLACTARPSSAAAVHGFTDACESTFDFAMTVSRIHEDPRVTKPYTEPQWQNILALGDQVDRELKKGDVRLTQGGEPTFVSISDMEAPEWNVAALGPNKLKLAQDLMQRLSARFATGPLLHFGQGKWYPGEPLPRWALGIYWRTDGKPILQHPEYIADPQKDYGYGSAQADTFAKALCEQLGLEGGYLIPAFEDIGLYAQWEQQLPDNLDPHDFDLNKPDERGRLARALSRGLGEVVGHVLPLRPVMPRRKFSNLTWESSPWPLRRDRLYLISGDSPIGYRLPLESLPWVIPEEKDIPQPRDPFDEAGELAHPAADKALKKAAKKDKVKPREIIHTALCVQARDGRLHVFMPPIALVENYLALVSAVEETAKTLQMPVLIEGYTPPWDTRLKVLNVTPDPGVIEVNIHPAQNWRELIANTTTLYEEARQSRLTTEKFMLDGRHTGTGGGNHVTLGGLTPADSPLLRRPDLLKSLITYWQNHPALSYLFSGAFIGPTSQAPRVDEARDDNLYELEIAFQQLEQQASAEADNLPWLTDRLLRNLLVDLTGNTHRSEFSIDKLYSPDSATGRLGLLEFRAFEMPPHAQMSITQMLLLRTLVARFWKTPYTGKLIHWGTSLHDRWMLPHFVEQDMQDIVRDLNTAGYKFDMAWFAPFIEFRFPRFGTVTYENIALEIRQAIEPWNVLGEEMSGAAAARYVDSSVERMQVKVRGVTGTRHVVTCNGRALPLQPTGVQGEFVAGLRFRAWSPPSALHPTIGVHAPLTFDIVDTWNNRTIGGCTYHVSHPGGRSYDTFPINANEAEARRVARFWNHGHTPGPMTVEPELLNPQFPFTLDLRRKPV